MMREKRQLIEAQIDLIVSRLVAAGLIDDDDDVTTKVANTIQSVLDDTY